jgi:hypothetical protein
MGLKLSRVTECSGFHEIEANIKFMIKLEETLEIAYYNLLSMLLRHLIM